MSFQCETERQYGAVRCRVSPFDTVSQKETLVAYLRDRCVRIPYRNAIHFRLLRNEGEFMNIHFCGV